MVENQKDTTNIMMIAEAKITEMFCVIDESIRILRKKYTNLPYQEGNEEKY